MAGPPQPRRLDAGAPQLHKQTRRDTACPQTTINRATRAGQAPAQACSTETSARASSTAPGAPARAAVSPPVKLRRPRGLKDARIHHRLGGLPLSPRVLRVYSQGARGCAGHTVGAQQDGAVGCGCPRAHGAGQWAPLARCTVFPPVTPASTPNRERPRQILSKGDRSSTGKDSAGFRNVEIRLGAATAASSARPPGARPPGRARGSAARGGRARSPGRAGARALDRARGGRASPQPIPSQPDELSR